MFMSEKTMLKQSFFPRFFPRKRLKIHKYCGSILFLASPLWLKTSQIFRHMANISAFGDVASGQRQRCIDMTLILVLVSIDKISVFLILDMHVRNKKSGISSLYPA